MLAFVATALVLTATPSSPPAAARPRMAVLDLRAIQGVAAGTATILTSIIVNDASRAGFDVISQADVSTLLGVERQKQVLGCSEDTGCLAEIGGALGADLVLSGQVGQIGTRYHLALQMLDAKKARVVARSAQFCQQSEDALAMTAQSSLAELIAAARVQLAPRPAIAPGPATTAPPPRLQPQQPSTQLAAPPPAGPAWRPSRRLALGTLGAGVALALGGGVSYAIAAARRGELEDGWQRLDYATFYDQKQREVKQFTTIGNVAFGAGLAVSALGGWFLHQGREPRLSLLPDLSTGRAGLVAVGSF